MILERGCAERGCACYDVRVDEGVEVKTVRELTDEEIMEVYDREELYNIDEGQMYLNPIEFARELLAKACN